MMYLAEGTIGNKSLVTRQQGVYVCIAGVGVVCSSVNRSQSFSKSVPLDGEIHVCFSGFLPS